MHEPRYKQGMGLHYSIHATGPDHGSGMHDDVISDKDINARDRIDVAEESIAPWERR